MKGSSYRDRDYAFGQVILTMRARIRLTQEGLADLLAVSRRAVADWEAGNSYPKAEHLKQLIALGIEQHAFHTGHEVEEIHQLWRISHQKVLLDEVWLAEILSHTKSPVIMPLTAQASASAVDGPRVDWNDALAIPNFYGRKWEVNLLAGWIVDEHCRVVSVIGLGGIGKSALAVSLMHQLAEHFHVVIWRSLRDLPNSNVLLDSLLQVVAPDALTEVNVSTELRQSFLLESMRQTRVLFVLDNLESVMEEGKGTGHFLSEYEGLGLFLRLSAETEHQSCVLITSREKPIDILAQESSRAPVRTLRLARLDADACEKLLTEKGVKGTAADQARLIDMYAGNPLALKIVTQTILHLFEGEIAPFLEQGEVIFGGVRELLSAQFARLSDLEQSLLLWLAILREPATLNELLAVLVTPVSRPQILEAVEVLYDHSLVERGQRPGSFTLQSVVLEYATARLVAEASEEIQEKKLVRLIDHGLELGQAREYVRQTQERIIVAPVLDRLKSAYPQQEAVEKRLITLLEQLTSLSEASQGYGPANLVTLLRLQRGNLRGLELGELMLRGVYLQGVEMQDTKLVNAMIRDSIFTETFDALTAVAISRTGAYWAGASRRGEVRIWEADGRLLHRAWRGHADMIWSMAFSPDESTLATGSWDSTIKVWDVSNGALLWSGRHTSQISHLVISPDGSMLASAGNDGTVRLWDMRNGTLLLTLPHPSSVLGATWSPDGSLIASGDAEGRIRLWAISRTEPAKDLQVVMEHQKAVIGLAFAPDGRTLASGGWDGTARLWDLTTGTLLQTLTGHTDRVGTVVWSPDGGTLATGSSDQTILLWDVEKGSYRAVLKGHTEYVYELAFSPDGLNLLSSSRDGTLRVWDTVTGQSIRVISGYAVSIYDVDWSPDGTQLVSGGTDRSVTTWDINSKTPLQALPGHYGIVCTVGWNPRGRWLASSESEHAIRLWDLDSRGSSQFIQNLDDSGKYMYRLAWNLDGERLASGTNPSGVTIWNIVNKSQQSIGGQFDVRYPCVVWSPDGKYLAGGGDDGDVYIWNVAEDALVQRLAGNHSLIKSLAWSPDGTHLASGANRNREEGGDLFVWDVLQGERLYTFGGHSGIVTALAWDSMGKVLISGGGDGVLRWWDVQRGEGLWVHEAHEGTVRSLRRSPDGSKLASCGDDGAIMIWNLNTGEHLQTLRRDRPYERLNITGIKGLTEAQKATLRTLGAIDEAMNDPNIG